MAASMYNAWIGAETGILKGVNLKKKTTTNFMDFQKLEKDHEIVSMSYGGLNQEEKIIVGLRDGVVREFDVLQAAFTSSKEYGELGSVFVGLSSTEDSIITCSSKGSLKVWKDDEISMKIDAGKGLRRMRHNIETPNLVATGGQENDLKVFDLEKPEKPIFFAKNVRNNFLDLRVPICINDIAFLRGSSKIATCTAHHQVRLYDHSTSSRRPVLDVNFEDCPIMSIEVTQDQRSVIVGNSHGRMAKIDLRNGLVSRVYRGIAGSIRCIRMHPVLPLVGSVGLDRFFRLHDIESGDLEKKVYLKSRLNCLLMTHNDFTKDDKEDEDKIPKEEESDEEEDEDESGDEMWSKLEVVGDEDEESTGQKPKRRKKKQKNEAKKRKK